MSKYDPLYDHLLYSGADKVTMSFEEVEKVIGAALPPSAREHNEWWANNPSGHTQAKSWYMASYRTDGVKVESGHITFILDLPTGSGLMETRQASYASVAGQSSAQAPVKRTHPLFGSMKGTTRVVPGYDLASPTYLLLNEPDDPA